MSNEQAGVPEEAADSLPVNGHEQSAAAAEVEVEAEAGNSLENGGQTQTLENGVQNGGADASVDGDNDAKETENEQPADIPAEPSEDPQQKFLHKRQYVVQELIDTERDYARDLGQVVVGYMVALKEMQLPEDFQGKDKIVFGNIQQIYEFHRDTFSQELEKCLQAPDRVGSPFVRYERRLSTIYVKYCENKPKSDYIVSEYIDTIFEDVRQKLGHRLQLQDLLIKPVQRIMKYQLLLKDIMKHSERAGVDCNELKRALDVMHRVPKEANDMMQVGRLQGFPGKITALGKLLLQDTLQVAVVTPLEPTPRYKERRVFLFEQMIVFSDVSERKRGPVTYSTYTYKNSAEINNMKLRDRLEPPENETVKFMIMHRAKDGTETKFFVDPLNDENRATWMHSLNTILSMQRDFLTALQDPKQYLKGLSGDDKPAGSATPPVSSKSGEASKKTSDTSVASTPANKPMLAKSLSSVGAREASPADQGANSGRSTIGPSAGKKKNIFGSLWKNKKSGSATPTTGLQGDADTRETEAPSTERKRKQPPSCKANKVLVNSTLNSIECQPLVKVCEAAHGDAKNDQLSVQVGEVLLVLQCNESASQLRVRRYDTPANGSGGEAEGWVPLSAVGMTDAVVRSAASADDSAKSAKKNSDSGKKQNGNGETDADVSFSGKLGANTFVRKNGSASIQCAIASRSKSLLVCWTRPDSLVCNKSSSEQAWSYNELDDSSTQTLGAMQHASAGLYTCLVVSNQTAIAAASYVSVGESPSAPGKPQVSNKGDRSVLLSWNVEETADRDKATRIYVIETKTASDKQWRLVTAHCVCTSHIVQELTDDSYVFRVRAASAFGLSSASEPSDEIRVPVQTDSTASAANATAAKTSWKSGFEQHFERTQRLHEGKFSMTALCKMTNCGTSVITKHIRKQARTKDAVTADANALDRLGVHPFLCKLMDRFDTSIDWVFVFEYCPEGNLCDYITKQYGSPLKDFLLSESQCSVFTAQLFDLLLYMNSMRIMHLNIRPESLLLCATHNGWSIKLGSFEYVCSADVPAEMLAKLIIYANAVANETQRSTEQIEFVSPFMLTVAQKVKQNNAEAKSVAIPTALAHADFWSTVLITHLLLHGQSLFYDASYELAAQSLSQAQFSSKLRDVNVNETKELSAEGEAFVRKALDALAASSGNELQQQQLTETLKTLRADKWLDVAVSKATNELSQDVIGRFRQSCERRLKFHNLHCTVCSSESTA